MKKILILGAGTWGLSLAKVLADNNIVTVWSALENEITNLKKDKKIKNISGVVLPDNITFTTDISLCTESDFIIIAVPSLYVRSTIEKAKPFIKDQIIVNVAKGIEPHTLMTMTDIILDELGEANVVALSGPTHAEEVAINLPTTIVAAASDLNIANEVVALFKNTCMRVYTNSDVKGVEICGALKNIIALSAGISDGIGYGDNIKAAIMTRGIAEIRRLGLALGCNDATFSGLAGIGDLIVTASSKHSRNNNCGNLIGKGYSVKDAISEVGMVVEGINALPAAVTLSKKYNIDMPITLAVNEIVINGADVKETVKALLDRPNKEETK